MKKTITKTTLAAMLALFVWSSSANAQVMVDDIFPGLYGSNPNNSNPKNFASSNGLLFFTANNGSSVEVFRSDGSTAGTFLLTSSPTGLLPNFTDVNGTAFFTGANASGYELWKSDGTVAGTLLVKDINPGVANAMSTIINGIFNVNGVAFFGATDGTNGTELWKSDGTNAGTVMVKDINPGSTGGWGSAADGAVNINGALFFSANDGTNGAELWKSDGTDAGTVMVKDINPGSTGSAPGTFVNANGTLFFLANDGTNGQEIWKSDGTDAGTVMVKDLNFITNPSSFTVLNGTIYFRGYETTHGKEMWKSDGTDAGTVLVKDIETGIGAGTNAAEIVNVNGTIYLQAGDGVLGYELWKSDGTDAGTIMVKDINPGNNNSTPTSLTNVNGTLFFSANDGTNGYELWKSDGTDAGTIMVGNINPGSAASNPANLLNVNTTLFFAANDGANGTELWKYDNLTGIPSLTVNNNYTIHPNPANNQLTIETDKYTNANLEIFNMQGQLVQSEILQSSKTIVQVCNLSSGVYFVKVKNTEGVSIQKFIKE